jgi:hypothetical protein
VGGHRGALHFEKGHIEMTELKLLLREIKPKSCKFLILVPEHYRADGSCLCDDEEHRKMMIKKWGYAQEDFDT